MESAEDTDQMAEPKRQRAQKANATKVKAVLGKKKPAGKSHITGSPVIQEKAGERSDTDASESESPAPAPKQKEKKAVVKPPMAKRKPVKRTAKSSK